MNFNVWQEPKHILGLSCVGLSPRPKLSRLCPRTHMGMFARVTRGPGCALGMQPNCLASFSLRPASLYSCKIPSLSWLWGTPKSSVFSWPGCLRHSRVLMRRVELPPPLMVLTHRSLITNLLFPRRVTSTAHAHHPLGLLRRRWAHRR